MLSSLFRYLYHARQRRAAKRRLSGRPRRDANWHRFSYNVFRRARSDKSGFREQYGHWIGWCIGLPIGLFALWFFWQSIEAIGMFQP